MASAKIATLVIRTLAKPISNQIKTQAKQHERFRDLCVGLAQRMHRTEVQLRTRLLGEAPKTIRPLSETRAIENGANALAEGFLFGVAALLILGETWRSSRSQTKRREGVDEKLEELQQQVEGLSQRVDALATASEERHSGEQQRNDELTRILERIVEIGLRGGWAEFEGTPLTLPRISLPTTQLSPPPNASSHTATEGPSS
ncbi:OPA3-domain-containing protein [Irpex rosettiformis]|uniref:OPA3-domain-containing protein n=1 Tax=Irpex rosettiformis TaxID=378272 RepID=A0ACB8TV66_9APHY|nr:OPA3-domain-containing protein [Irpex rosettiformis]